MPDAEIIPAALEPRGYVGSCLKQGLSTCGSKIESEESALFARDGWSMAKITFQPDQRFGAECYGLYESLKAQNSDLDLEGLRVGYLCAHPKKPDYTVLVVCNQMFKGTIGPNANTAKQCAAFINSPAVESFN
jgi:hypothetical protein